MKILIESKEKTIKIEEEILLSDLIAELETILPCWRTYKLIPSIVNINIPIIDPMPYIPYPVYPNYPTYQPAPLLPPFWPTIIYGTDSKLK
jgi:hypothetical protein